MDEDHTTLLSGVGLLALLSQEHLERIAHGIPAKSFEVGERVFTPTYRGEVFRTPAHRGQGRRGAREVANEVA